MSEQIVDQDQRYPRTRSEESGLLVLTPPAAIVIGIILFLISRRFINEAALELLMEQVLEGKRITDRQVDRAVEQAIETAMSENQYVNISVDGTLFTIYDTGEIVANNGDNVLIPATVEDITTSLAQSNFSRYSPQFRDYPNAITNNDTIRQLVNDILPQDGQDQARQALYGADVINIRFHNSYYFYAQQSNQPITAHNFSYFVRLEFLSNARGVLGSIEINNNLGREGNDVSASPRISVNIMQPWSFEVELMPADEFELHRIFAYFATLTEDSAMFDVMESYFQATATDY